MECVIYRCGKAVGTLRMEEDGLYHVLEARIEASKQLLRLYAPQKIGVFFPEGDALLCRKRISRTQMPVLPQWASAWCEEDGQWIKNPDGHCTRYVPEGMEEGIRWQQQTEMIFPAAPEQLQMKQLAGAAYLCFLHPYGNQEMIRRML